MWVSQQWAVFTEQMKNQARHPPAMRLPRRGWCAGSTAPSLHPNPLPQPQLSRACAAVREADTHTHAHTCAHTRTRLPWLERMGWGREAEEGATLGGELLGLTQGAAASRESSLT